MNIIDFLALEDSMIAAWHAYQSDSEHEDTEMTLADFGLYLQSVGDRTCADCSVPHPN